MMACAIAIVFSIPPVIRVFLTDLQEGFDRTPARRLDRVEERLQRLEEIVDD